MFSDFADGGPMWTGEGARSAERQITFAAPYRSPPQVMVSLSMFDMDQASNQRADLFTQDVDEIGFTLIFRTWGDTRVARIRADWFSIGELHHPDDWDIESR